MDRRAHALVGAALLLCGGTVSAFYSSVSPPAGVSATSAASNAIANAQASSRFTGTVTKVPVAIRVAAGAGRIAARAIVGGGVLGVAVAGAAWLAENCFAKQNGQWVRTCGAGSAPQSDGWQYTWKSSPSQTDPWWDTPEAACAGYYAASAALDPQYEYVPNGVDGVPGTYQCKYIYKYKPTGQVINPDAVYSLNRRQSSCPAGWYQTSAGCVQNPPPSTVTPQEIEDEMEQKPVPPEVWPELVPTQVPIELPTLNPDPADPTKPSPWKEPTGNPVPIPDTNPQRYKQPWVTIKPAPTATDPWRVDVQPESTETNSPNPVGPDGIAGPQTSNDNKKPEEKQLDLCEKHPEIIACQKLEFDTPDAPDLEQKERGGPITPDSGWGPSDANCPAPRHVVVQGRDIPIPFDLFCQYMAGLRPVILAMAWLGAAFIFVGGIRSGD